MPSRQPTLPDCSRYPSRRVLAIISAFWKSFAAVEQRQDDQRVVGHDVAVAAVLVVAVLLGDQLAGRRASRPSSLGVPLADVVDQRGGSAQSRRDEAEADVEQLVEVALDEGLRLHRRQQLRGIDRLAVVADAGGAARPDRRPAPGRPGATIAQPSMKICAPICSATDLAVQRDRAAAAAPGCRASAAGRRCARSSCPCRPTRGSARCSMM